MPIYSPEREDTGIPDAAHAFLGRITTADGVILSLAEYNGSYTAAFKNVFDWTSRINMKLFQDKPMLLLATSIGKGGGSHVLSGALGAFPHFGAKITSNFSIGPFQAHFDSASGGLTDADKTAELAKAIAAFHAALPSP